MICKLCFHHCYLSEGQTGFCRARACRNRSIVPLNYGKVTSLALDPIEKKSLRRFRPGSMILSVDSFGCNLRCPFCQNHEISMSGDGELETEEVSPETLADKALELQPYDNTVKRSISLAAEQCHVEVTTLLIPGENDSEEEIKSLAHWLASVDRKIPLHLSRFFPQYRMIDKPPTPVERVYHLADTAREYLSFVYTGNC